MVEPIFIAHQVAGQALDELDFEARSRPDCRRSDRPPNVVQALDSVGGVFGGDFADRHINFAAIRDEAGGEASADHADRQRRGRYFAAARTPVPVDLISACRASTRALTVRVFDLC